MRSAQLVRQSLQYHWRTNLAVVFGVATAVAVLAGALLVGESVRASLRDLFLRRLGNTTHVISAPEFFREQLAGDLQSHKQFAANGFQAACPLIELEAAVSHATSGRRAAGVRVYGIDERFWRFHGRDGSSVPQNREVFVSDSLARELEGRSGDSLLIRIEKPSVIPVESLHGRKEDLGRTLRLTISSTLAADALGEFSVQPQQTPVRAVFVPLRLLQKELGQEDRVNMILISQSPNQRNSSASPDDGLNKILKETATLEDYGIKLRMLEQPQSLSLERSSTFIDDALANTGSTVANRLSMQTAPLLSYLANGISFGERSIPYSLVTAIDEGTFEKLIRENDKTLASRSDLAPGSAPPIILNEWAARDLGASRGGAVSLEYYHWHEDGRLEEAPRRRRPRARPRW